VELIVEDPEDTDMIEIEVEIMKADPGDEEVVLDETVVEEEEMSQNPVAGKRKQFICPICSKSFASWTSLYQHRKRPTMYRRDNLCFSSELKF
jgi:hypothetical protein